MIERLEPMDIPNIKSSRNMVYRVLFSIPCTNVAELRSIKPIPVPMSSNSNMRNIKNLFICVLKIEVMFRMQRNFRPFLLEALRLHLRLHNEELPCLLYLGLVAIYSPDLGMRHIPHILTIRQDSQIICRPSMLTILLMVCYLDKTTEPVYMHQTANMFSCIFAAEYDMCIV